MTRNMCAKRIIACVLSISMALSLVCINADASSLSELERQRQQAVSEKNSLERQAEDIHEDYQDVRAKYNDLLAEVNESDINISQLSEELQYLSVQLSEAKTNSEEMEAAMKLHIKFMYENGVMSLIEVLLESGSVAEFFEKFEYLTMILKYDRDMVDAYKKTQEEISDKAAALSAKREELDQKSEELNQKKVRLKQLVESAGDELSEINARVGDAQAEINAYDQQIAKMKEYEKQLASRNAASQEALARQIGNFPNTEDTSGALVGYTPDDLYLLAAIIHAEAEGEPYEGKIAVGSVVMNRVFSSRFPSTISGVVYQKNQFEPVASGRLQLILDRGPNADCFSAAREVLGGVRNVDKLFFWALWLAEERGLVGVQDGIIIGKQFFF